MNEQIIILTVEALDNAFEKCKKELKKHKINSLPSLTLYKDIYLQWKTEDWVKYLKRKRGKVIIKFVDDKGKVFIVNKDGTVVEE